MIVGVLLAAGESTRFGEDKLVLPLANGTPMVCAAARRLRSATDALIGVVRPGPGSVSQLLAAERAHVIECPDARLGMGHSIACGVRASAEADGWIIALGDMPFIESATIAAIADALRAGAALVAPAHAGRRGHPVGFARQFGDELQSLAGDQGARAILSRAGIALCMLPCNDPGVLSDIDTPADLNDRESARGSSLSA